METRISSVALAAVGTAFALTFPTRRAWKRSPRSYCQELARVLRKHEIPGEPGPIQIYEGVHVFTDGSGVVTWPTAVGVLAHLRQIGKAGLVGFGEEPSNEVAKTANWKGCRVLELGCGCGLVAVCLARWGASVVAVDANPAALELAEENIRMHCASKFRPVILRYLDWRDLDACRNLWDELGPFDVILCADCILSSVPSGPMWRQTDIMTAIQPGPLLDASRELARHETGDGGHSAALGPKEEPSIGSAVVMLAVVDRAGEVAEMAQAILTRREEGLKLCDLPLDLVTRSGGRTTLFCFCWARESDVARGQDYEPTC